MMQLFNFLHALYFPSFFFSFFAFSSYDHDADINDRAHSRMYEGKKMRKKIEDTTEYI